MSSPSFVMEFEGEIGGDIKITSSSEEGWVNPSCPDHTTNDPISSSLLDPDPDLDQLDEDEDALFPHSLICPDVQVHEDEEDDEMSYPHNHQNRHFQGNQDEDDYVPEEEDGEHDDQDEEEEGDMPLNPWMGHQMMEEEEDKDGDPGGGDEKKEENIDHLLPLYSSALGRRNRKESESDESFAPPTSDKEEDHGEGESSDEEEYESGDDKKRGHRDKYTYRKRKRVYEALHVIPVSSLPTSPPWVALKRMPPSLRLDLALSRVSIQYEPRAPAEIKSRKTGGLPCPQCGVGFSDKYKLARHLKRIHPPEDEKTLKCPHCSSTWNRITKLNAHIRDKHPDPGQSPVEAIRPAGSKSRPLSKGKGQKKVTVSNVGEGIPCPKCEKWLSNRQKLNRHINRMHAREGSSSGGSRATGKGTPCPHCPMVIRFKPHFKKHLDKHVREGTDVKKGD